MAADRYTITVCQGPPRCELTDDAAVQAQLDGCPWCTRIHGDWHGEDEVAPTEDSMEAGRPYFGGETFALAGRRSVLTGEYVVATCCRGRKEGEET